jgi:hypothetical protein
MQLHGRHSQFELLISSSSALVIRVKPHITQPEEQLQYVPDALQLYTAVLPPPLPQNQRTPVSRVHQNHLVV